MENPEQPMPRESEENRRPENTQDKGEKLDLLSPKERERLGDLRIQLLVLHPEIEALELKEKGFRLERSLGPGATSEEFDRIRKELEGKGEMRIVTTRIIVNKEPQLFSRDFWVLPKN